MMAVMFMNNVQHASGFVDCHRHFRNVVRMSSSKPHATVNATINNRVLPDDRALLSWSEDHCQPMSVLQLLNRYLRRLYFV